MFPRYFQIFKLRLNEADETVEDWICYEISYIMQEYHYTPGWNCKQSKRGKSDK